MVGVNEQLEENLRKQNACEKESERLTKLAESTKGEISDLEQQKSRVEEEIARQEKNKAEAEAHLAELKALEEKIATCKANEYEALKTEYDEKSTHKDMWEQNRDEADRILTQDSSDRISVPSVEPSVHGLYAQKEALDKFIEEKSTLVEKSEADAEHWSEQADLWGYADANGHISQEDRDKVAIAHGKQKDSVATKSELKGKVLGGGSATLGDKGTDAGAKQGSDVLDATRKAQAETSKKAKVLQCAGGRTIAEEQARKGKATVEQVAAEKATETQSATEQVAETQSDAEATKLSEEDFDVAVAQVYDDINHGKLGNGRESRDSEVYKQYESQWGDQTHEIYEKAQEQINEAYKKARNEKMANAATSNIDQVVASPQSQAGLG